MRPLRKNLWHHSSAEKLETTPLSRDAEADLLVIGGGFTGCAAALEAARQGARVQLLEAQQIGHGGSGRNVGLVNAGLWLPPDDVIRALGQDHGLRLVQALSAGPATVFDLIARERIDCEAEPHGTLHLAHAPAGLADLKTRLEQGRRLGAPLSLLDAAETARRTGSHRFHGALLDPRAGTVQPLAYCRGLARAAQRAGASLHENSPVSTITREGGTWVATVGRHRVRAQSLLLATNAYHAGITGGCSPQYVAVSYSQFATAPLPPDVRARILPGREGCWDTALVMSSLRVDRAGRVIIGGIGNIEGYGAPAHDSWARRKLRYFFPELAGAPFDYSWRGRIAMTADHIPKVLSFGPSALAIFGYSGRGISPGTIFGTTAAQALLQNRDELLPIPPIERYREAFTGLRGSYYEAGALLTHSFDPLPLTPQS